MPMKYLGMLALAVTAVILSYQPGVGSNLAPPLSASPVQGSLMPFTDQPWDRLIGNYWNYLRRSNSDDADVVVDTSAPMSPPNVLRIVFTPNLEHDRQPTVHWTSLPHVNEVHATWWIKLSPNWKANPAGAGKMTFLWPSQGNGVLYSNLAGGSLPHRVNIVTTWPPYGYRFWDPNVATTEISYDRWYQIEWYVKWESSPGVGDGIIRWWVNQQLNGDYSNLSFPACCLLQFEFAPTVQNPPPANQYMYIDHTRIAIP